MEHGARPLDRRDFTAPPLSGEHGGDGGEGNTPDKAPPLPMWDQLLDDKAVRRWLSPPAGVVLCIGAESLSGHGDDTAAFMRQRLLTVRNRLGNAPVCLLVTGLEQAPGLSRLARHFTAEISIGRNALHAPLGWFMPVRRLWTPMPRWAADGVREGMNGLTAALDSLVRCSESGISAPGGPAFLLEGALRHLASPLASFAAALGDGLGGIFWAALPPASSAFQQATRLSPVMKDRPPPALRSSASVPFSVPGGAPLAASLASQPSATVPAGSRFTSSSGIAAHPCSYGISSSKHCQLPGPFQPQDGGHGRGPSAGPPQSSLPSPPGLRCTVAGNVPKPFCRT